MHLFDEDFLQLLSTKDIVTYIIISFSLKTLKEILITTQNVKLIMMFLHEAWRAYMAYSLLPHLASSGVSHIYMRRCPLYYYFSKNLIIYA